MKRLIFSLCLVISFAACAADKATDDGPRFDFRGINVAQVVQLIYSEALRGAYVIDPDVLGDQRPVSFRYESSSGDLKLFISTFFDSLGLAVTQRHGVDYVARKAPKESVPETKDVLVYRPRFRDGSYLVDLLSPLLKGQFTARRVVHAAANDKAPQGAVPPGSAAAMIDRKSDTLVFSGTLTEIEMLKKMLAQVDTSIGDVLVRGVLYEVQTTDSDGSAFGLALSLLGSKFGLNLGTAKPTGNFLRFTNNSIDAVLSSLSADSRFTVKSTPTLRVSSGGTGRFTVGQDVPVLGAVTFAGNAGAPVRSVEYRSSGVIFDLQPVLHDDGVDLTVMQQVSNFVATETGVNDSPTLIKRELKTSLSLTDGELVVIGGLAENKETSARNGLAFVPSFLHTKSYEKTNTEILLVLQVTKI